MEPDPLAERLEDRSATDSKTVQLLAVTRAQRAWEAAGLAKIGLHEARHTYASLMIAAGANAKALSTYMGHSSVTVTYDRYGHLMPGNENEAAALLDTYLNGANTGAHPAQTLK